MGVAVAVLWGTALLGGLVPQDGVSWQGHLFGAVGGVSAARLLRRERPRAERPLTMEVTVRLFAMLRERAGLGPRWCWSCRRAHGWGTRSTRSRVWPRGSRS